MAQVFLAAFAPELGPEFDPAFGPGFEPDALLQWRSEEGRAVGVVMGRRYRLFPGYGFQT